MDLLIVRHANAFARDRLLTSPLVRARQTVQILTDVAGWPQAEEAPELWPGEPTLALLTLLGKDRSKLIAVVGRQPGLGALLTACLLGDGGALPIEMKKNAVACVSPLAWQVIKDTREQYGESFKDVCRARLHRRREHLRKDRTLTYDATLLMPSRGALL